MIALFRAGRLPVDQLLIHRLKLGDINEGCDRLREGIQNAMTERNAGVPDARRIEFRIGIHLGDVVEESDGDLMGDGVNIAARLEGIAAPGAICLSEDAYRQVKARLELQVSDLGATLLKNIADPMRVYSLQVGKPAEAKPAAPVEAKADDEVLAFPAPSDKPSIAVLPFQNMSGDPEQEFFADGLVEDIITTLSKLAGLTVIARNSTFVYKGRAVDLREVGKELGVRYLLEGSVRRAGDKIRVAAQLIDARTGSHVWAERYDRGLDDIFAVQDEITLVLATEMQVKLTEGEQARLRYTTTGNVEAWTLWVQGLSFARQAVSKENLTRALALWQRALALDPDSSPLNAMVGLIHVGDARFGWWLCGCARWRLTGRFEEAIAAFVAYDARSAGFGLTDLVIAYQQTNRPDLARQTAERFLVLRPAFTVAGWLRTQFRRDRALLDAEAAALAAAGLPPG